MSDRGPDDVPRRAAPRRIPPNPSGRVPPGRVPPSRVPPGRVPPDRVPPDRSPAGPTPLAGPLADAPPISGHRGTTVGAAAASTPSEPTHGRHERAARPAPAGGTVTADAPATDGDGDGGNESHQLARDSDSSIMRTSGSIALATLTSRITGFVRTVLVLAMLGPAIASAFQAAYVLPNMIAEVVLGAVLTAIVIPVLVRAEAEDDDGGRGFINRIFTLTVVTLGVATVIALIAAPLLTLLNVGDGDVNRPLTTALAYLLLPEILFYGLSALFIAILNMKGFFKPGAWAPVLNNIVQITTLVIYALMPGEISLNPVRMTDPQLLVLGIGTTLGVVMQVTILVPWLRRAGVRLAWKWGLDARLRRFGNMAVAIVGYVAVLQVGLVVTYRIAAHADASGISVYATHWQLLQLPYGVLGVTILTAIMPRLSRNAAAEDTQSVVDDLSLATRLTMVALVPVVAYMTFFGPAIGIAVFNFGKFDAAVASQLGSTLAWGAFTLIPYAMTLVQLRVFYAREDAWTPTVMVLGITAVKVASSYLGPVLFSDPDLVVRWLALSNGLGYLVGAIVGHYLLQNRLAADQRAIGKEPLRPTLGSAWTTTVTLIISIAMAFVIWLISELSGLHLATQHGKIGSIAYLFFTAVIVLGVIYAGLAAAGVPDVVAILTAVQRMAGRFVPALAPKGAPEPESAATITVQFPRITGDEPLPYSGQVQVVRRFDRGSATWQSYSVHTGGAAGNTGVTPWSPPQRPPDMRYRRRGVRRVNESGVDTGPEHPTPQRPTTQRPSTDGDTPAPAAPHSAAATPKAAPTPNAVPTPNPDQADPIRAPRRRGPRLVPGAAVAGGRYRLLESHGGTRGLQFWKAQDINLDREVGLTFVDAEQLAPPPEKGSPTKAADTGPQAVLTRTLRLGQISSAGVARVLDVVRGSSGGIVVAEWVQGSSLAEVAGTHPSPIGAARAVRALAAAAEAAHRSGGALSIDHPDRIRISADGNAVLAFPGTLAGDDQASDVRGLGAVLYALLLARWPLDAETGSRPITTKDSTAPVAGLAVASPSADGSGPIEPREVDPDIPFEISAVAARALSGTRGIRTAATVQHVLDQATVVDLKTDMLPAVTDSDDPPVTMAPPGRIGSDQPDRRSRNLPLLVGAALLVVFVIVALVVWITGVFGSDDSQTDINEFLSTTPSQSAPAAPGAAPATGAITPRSATLVDFSSQSGDNPGQAPNVITGASGGWRSDANYATADFGSLKDGLGLMLDLGSPQAVKTVTIATTTPGFDVELRTATSADATLAETTRVGQGTVDQSSTTLTITNPQQARYLLVWITSLPSSGSNGYQVQVSKITMTS
ncbi:lipid II flippase MurJ [Gordonia sp. VNQ95]|uniref:murein biosynthesis integral membrane protein MurJ n=1 Tax=Gordonia sp. VNQ95 TaxID=3156619 RepID=UPI0032B4A44D